MQDPLSGRAALIAADRYVKARTDNLFDLPERAQVFQRREAFYGMELVQDTHRLALMNAMLHGIEGDLKLGDTLSSEGSKARKADVIPTNPPFGNKKGRSAGRATTSTYQTSNKQLSFYSTSTGASSGGRAGIVLPDTTAGYRGRTGVDVRARPHGQV